MADLVVICPTRGRPEAAQEAYRAFTETKAAEGTEILFVIDDDDPKIDGYFDSHVPALHLPPPGSMVAALNEGAKWVIENLDPTFVGFIGDDHRFRTPGWDNYFTDLLTERGGGMVYGNDTIRTDIPTQIVMSAAIVQKLGWMALPTCTHLYVDNVWAQLGVRAQALFYMPDVVIEHLHPAFGKGVWDEGYHRVNSGEMYSHDADAYHEWFATDMEGDVQRVKEALGR